MPVLNLVDHRSQMMLSARPQRAPALVLLGLLAACSAFDSDLLNAPKPIGDRDAAVDGGSVDAGEADAACAACVADPCNGRDDDDDGAIDEGDAASACPTQHADSVCIAGECLVVRCHDGYADCDGETQTGCEVELGSPASCAGCGDDCGTLAHSVGASCSDELRCRVEQCESGFVDCDDNPENGCEASFSEVLNCGGCASKGENETCVELPQVLTAACAKRHCSVTKCLPGFLDCNAKAADGCEREIAADGCCPDERDSDGDGTLDCLDVCKDDPDKTEPGACGCGVTDADMDMDGIADCRTDCWGFPSNFDPFDDALVFDADANLTCSPTIDTSQPAATMIRGWCNGTPPTPVTRAQSTGPSLVIIPLRGLTVAAGQVLRLIGDKPVLLAIEGDAHIEGAIDAGSNRHSAAGAGAGFACATGDGRAGARAVNDGAAGGGGASLATTGGRGGSSDDGQGGNAGAGVNTTLVPLRAGCAGGAGGNNGSSGGGSGGYGGGALQLSVTGRLFVANTGVISAAGGGGSRGTGDRDGGGGGGSGGAILIEANTIERAPSSWITANGGSGAAGNASSDVCSSADGRDGNATSASPTPGGAGCNDSGNGGSGAGAISNATNGSGADGNAAAGGGGGGLGKIVIQPLSGSVCAK